MSSEFASIDFQTPWGKVAIILILGTLLIAVFSRERWRLDELALMALALYYSLTYIRFMFLAAILLAPIFARRIKLMTPYDESTDKPLYNAVAFAVLLGLFIVSAPSKFQNSVSYPERAVAYMKTRGIRGRIFHEWVWGGYLIWHAPELKVFIDGRADPYGPTGVFRDYSSAVANEDPQAVFDKYQVEYVLMPSASPLTKYLLSSKIWIVQYRDETSVLFHRSPKS